MKIIILNIFFSLNIYAIICSKCEGLDKDNCLKSPTNEKYPDACCYFEVVNDSDNSEKKKFCKTVPFSSYSKENSKIYFNDTLYNVACPEIKKDNYNLERCGNTYNENPSKKDCRKYSTYVDSCCYYSGENNKDDPENKGEPFKKGCYWLGSKYEGSIFWAGARLECSFKFLNYSLFALVYLIILL